MLPEEFTEKLARLLPPERLEPVLETFTLRKPTAFRANTLKTSAEELEESLKAKGFTLNPVPWFPGAWTVPEEEHRKLTETRAFYEGRLYIQSLSSMAAARALDPKPEETVLDLAAAPGGKTALMAAMMENRGTLSAVEPGKERFFRMKRNLEEQGASMVKCYMADGRGVGRKCPEMFDKVLLDAPCSSESRFCTLDDRTTAYWSPRKVKEMSKLQKRLILSAVESLKPGGLLLYSTCSFSPEENEVIVDGLLSKRPEMEPLPLELPFPNWMEGVTGWGKKTLDQRTALCRRILPTKEMDGFFLCLLRKQS